MRTEWTPEQVSATEPLTVSVELENDDGERDFAYGCGATTDEAVAEAERRVRLRSGDESYCMSEWRAA